MIRSRIAVPLAAVVTLGLLMTPATHAFAGDRKDAPPVLTNPGMAYDAADGQVVLFGGAGQPNYRNGTWTWDGTAWTERHPKHSPSPRTAMGMAYDAITKEVVLFGGGGDGFQRGTWTW